MTASLNIKLKYDIKELSKGLIITIIPLLLSIYFASRSFCLGYSIATLILISLIVKTNTSAFPIVLCLAGISIFLLLACIFKTDSSLGRLLIYKVSFSILKDNYIQGIGFDAFKRCYLIAQAEYFSGTSFSEKELLLADNVSFAYNDYLQFIIELGIKGLIILISSFYVFYATIKKALDGLSNYPVLILVSLSQIIAISTAAVFTHVYDNPFFQSIILLSYLTLLIFSIKKQLLNKTVVISTYLILIAVVCLNKYSYKLINEHEYKDYEEARKLDQSGFTNEALETFQKISENLRYDLDFLMAYADILYSSGKIKEAKVIYLALAEKISDGAIYQKLGMCYYHLNENNLAEKNFKMSVDMVPNRFGSRLDLFNFYLNTNQILKAKLIGNSILTLPVKIPSKSIKKIKYTVENKLKFI